MTSPHVLASFMNLEAGDLIHTESPFDVQDENGDFMIDIRVDKRKEAESGGVLLSCAVEYLGVSIGTLTLKVMPDKLISHFVETTR